MTSKPDVAKGVRAFLEAPKQLFINGDWQSSAADERFTVENPATGDVLTEVSYGKKEDIDLAVEAARRAFDKGPWSSMSASARSRLIWRLGDLIDDHREELAQLESLDNGKPLAVARAADVPLAAEMFRYMAGWATKIHGETFPVSVPYTPDADYLSYTLKEPVGVVGQVIPWNFPLLMAAWKLAPALACGCVIVLKPAEQTPLSAIYLANLVREAGIPEGVLNIVTGYGDAGAALAAHEDVDKIAFTGSTEVGKEIVKAAAHVRKAAFPNEPWPVIFADFQSLLV
jgi:phenylacetaldehyde dehydrogenase